MSEQNDDPHPSRARWVFYGFLAIGGFLLFTEHRAHVLGILPYLFLLACPLMHMFMHHGHGAHGSHSEQGQHTHHHESSEGEPK
ncbi:MAG: DUF2933 domain-containing protein [Nitrosomonadales bacterium]|nr:DUF2933 domain-containing protein [Nitrosomonadales bacterium]